MSPAKVIVPPTGHLFSIEQCRAQCRVQATEMDSDGNEFHEDDDLLLSYLDAAVDMAEDFTGLSIALKTYEVALDAFPTSAYWHRHRDNLIELPIGPVVEVVHFIVGEDSSDADILFPEEDYIVDTYGQFATLRAVTAWPVRARSPNAIRIQFTAGYEVDSEGIVVSLPGAIKQAILLTLADWYCNREDTNDKQLFTLPNGAQALLRPKRVRLGMA